MFKRMLLLVVFFVGVFTYVYTDRNKNSVNLPSPSPKVLGIPESKFPQQVTLDGENFNVFWYKPQIENIVLIPNYEQKLTSDEVIKKYGCKFLINGGFYDEARKPLGLIISESNEITSYKKSKLFNGVLSVNQFVVPRITDYVPEDGLITAVQSGPIVFRNGSKSVISMENDKNARRSLAAVTGRNELVFVHFTGVNNSYYGPTLEQLPSLIEELNNKYDLGIADAINLDGGSASVYLKDDVRIKEISIPGAYFCEL